MTLVVAANTSKTLPKRFDIAEGAVRNCLISFARILDSGELLTGTPTVEGSLHDQDQDVSVSVSSNTAFADAKITNEGRNAAQVTIDEEGETVEIDEGVEFTLTADTATVNVWHRLKITATTDATNPQTIVAWVLVRVVDR